MTNMASFWSSSICPHAGLFISPLTWRTTHHFAGSVCHYYAIIIWLFIMSVLWELALLLWEWYKPPILSGKMQVILQLCICRLFKWSGHKRECGVRGLHKCSRSKRLCCARRHCKSLWGVTVMSCTISLVADCSCTAVPSWQHVETPIVHRGHLSSPPQLMVKQ